MVSPQPCILLHNYKYSGPLYSL